MGRMHCIRVLAIVLILSALAGCDVRETSDRRRSAATDPPSAGEPPVVVEIDAGELDVETAPARTLAAGEKHVLSVELAAGEYLHWSVEQLSLDVKVSVAGPDSPALIFDSPTGVVGAEQVVLETAASGRYRLLIEAWDPGAAGSYRIRLEARRVATERDRCWAAAVRAYYATRYGAATGYDQKVAGFGEAARLAEELGEQAFRARALFDLGKLYVRHGRPREALAVLKPALAIFRHSADEQKQALAHDQLGAAWRELGELRRSQQAFAAALELWRRLERPQEEATALSDLGLVAKQRGRYRLAFERYGEALELWQRLGDRCRAATTRTNLGKLYALFGELARAQDNYQQALAQLEGCGDAHRRAKELPVILTGMGKLLADQGKAEAALARYRQALALRRANGDRRGEAVTLNNIALAVSPGDPRSAFVAFRSSLEILRQLAAARGQATVLRNLAELQESAGDLAEARLSNQQALTLAREAGHREAQALALLGLARLAWREGDLEAARQQAEQAVDLVEAERGNIGRGDLRTSYLAGRQTYYDVLVAVLLDLHRRDPAQGYDRQALEATERARARGLLEVLSGSRAAVPAGPEIEALTAEINDAHREWLRASQQAARVEQRRIEVELRSLLGRLHALSVEDRSGPRAAGAPPPVVVDEIRGEILDDESLLLAYHLTPSTGWLWAVTSGGAVLRELPAGGSQIEPAAAALLASDLRTEAAPSRHLETLGRLLIDPAADLLGDRRLLIVGPGILQVLPFAALPDPGASRPLGLGHEVVHLPSLAVIRALRARPAPSRPKLSVGVVADAVYGPDDPRLESPTSPGGPRELPWLEPLPASRNEADAAIRWLGGPSRRYVGHEARRELFFGGELRTARVLHLATHALLDVPEIAAPNHGVDDGAPGVRPAAMVEAADLSAVVFSRFGRDGQPEDGYLRAYEIRRLDLAAELVVLSACRTMLGERVQGEGLIGLTHAFLAAGARQVVASLWDVDDRSTAELMDRFYQGLAAGLTTGRALQEAQAELWRREEWRAPYFWAGFVVQGDWHAPVQRPP